MPSLEEKIKKASAGDPKTRKALAARSFAWFVALYLPHYLKANSADFHYELYHLLQDDAVGLLEVIAFRGSAKSTITSLAFPLWCAVFKRRNFIVLCSDTGVQAKQIISNLIHELEDNARLKHDFGDMKTKDDEWQATNVLLKNGVRILSRSRGQKIRGLRHLEFRPDLIVCDDVENIEDVRTKEMRDKTEEWFLSDVLPSIDATNGKVAVIGNMLHQDGLMARLKNKIATTEKSWEVREYPLIDPSGACVWPEAFPPEKLEELKRNRFFRREFLLLPQLDENALVKRVGYYETLPELQRIAIGVDLAISKSQTADYTAINVAGEGSGSNTIYNIKSVCGRWDFNETLGHIKEVYDHYVQLYPNLAIHLGFEDVAYQRAAIEEFYRRFRIQPTAIPQTKDKRARIETFLPYLENDQILFRRDGMEDLLIQLLNLGVEAHDDLVDAAEISWRLIVNAERAEVMWI